MKANLSITNRIVRLVIAAIIIAFYFTNIITGLLATILLVLAGMMFITGAISFCPMAMIGICPGDLFHKMMGKKDK